MTPISIAVRLFAGITLGFFFYAGLWYTVHRLPQSSHPVALTMGSFWIRTILVVASVVPLAGGRWEFALICLVGFAIGRVIVTKALVILDARTKCT